MIDLGHKPERPSWKCQEDGEPWPCEAAQQTLRAQHPHESLLASTLWNLWQEAIFDQVLDPADIPAARAEGFRLHAQFFAWTRTNPGNGQ